MNGGWRPYCSKMHWILCREANLWLSSKRAEGTGGRRSVEETATWTGDAGP